MILVGDSHKQVGMKKKGGKMVPNCVPKNESFNVKSPVIFSKPEEKVEEIDTVRRNSGQAIHGSAAVAAA